MAELASRIAEWPGDSDHTAQIIRRTPRCAPPITAAVITWCCFQSLSGHDLLSLHPQAKSWTSKSWIEIPVWRPQLFAHPISWLPFLLFRRWCAAMASLTRAQLVQGQLTKLVSFFYNCYVQLGCAYVAVSVGCLCANSSKRRWNPVG